MPSGTAAFIDKRRLKSVSLTVALAMLSACTTNGEVRSPQSTQTVPSENALAFPPPGGPSIVSVIERRYDNGVEQDISLFTSAATPGQNALRIKFLGASGSQPNGVGAASFVTIKDSTINREIRRELPRVVMARSPLFLQNNYGPFGYASGRSRLGDTCIYAWQQIRSSQNAQTAVRNFGMIQVRLRLCDAVATERQLLAVMYGYTITGSFNGEIWNPYGSVAGADPGLGRTGNPIYPYEADPTHRPPPIGYEPARIIVRPASAPPVPTRRTAPVPRTLPSPTGPIVPPPPDQNGGTSGIVVPSPQ
ncbi:MULTISPECIES: cellulose biosynthesis protein BcsN [unclassified Sinorhizobium]|uniref:cellulose biosynthesis protein BcsN n=1 Tax=unclassified Sinorhizobium TaxID=2613772 RepID=UPI003523D9EB